jgi:hypothetical protein
MSSSLVSCRQRITDLAAVESSQTAERRAGLFSPRTFQQKMFDRLSLIGGNLETRRVLGAELITGEQTPSWHTKGGDSPNTNSL